MVTRQTTFVLIVALALLASAPAARAEQGLNLPNEPHGRERLGPANPCVNGDLRVAFVTNGTANPFKGPVLHRGSACAVQIECDTNAGAADGAALRPTQILRPGQTMAGFACPATTAFIGLRAHSTGGSYLMSFQP